MSLIDKGIVTPFEISNRLNYTSNYIGRLVKRFTGGVNIRDFISSILCIKCKCDGCDNIVWIDDRGPLTYCSKACKTSDNWSDESYRSMMTENSRRFMSNLWTNEDFISSSSVRASMQISEQWKTKEFKELRSRSAKEQWIGIESSKKLHKGRNDIYVVHGLNCRCNYEAYFINYLNDNGYKLPINCSGVQTNSGTYNPDFEYDKFYVEIKSTYYLNNSILNGQMKKIDWTSENVKPVVVLDLDNDYSYKLIEELIHKV